MKRITLVLVALALTGCVTTRRARLVATYTYLQGRIDGSKACADVAFNKVPGLDLEERKDLIQGRQDLDEMGKLATESALKTDQKFRDKEKALIERTTP